MCSAFSACRAIGALPVASRVELYWYSWHVRHLSFLGRETVRSARFAPSALQEPCEVSADSAAFLPRPAAVSASRSWSASAPCRVAGIRNGLVRLRTIVGARCMAARRRCSLFQAYLLDVRCCRAASVTPPSAFGRDLAPKPALRPAPEPCTTAATRLAGKDTDVVLERDRSKRGMSPKHLGRAFTHWASIEEVCFVPRSMLIRFLPRIFLSKGSLRGTFVKLLLITAEEASPMCQTQVAEFSAIVQCKKFRQLSAFRPSAGRRTQGCRRGAHELNFSLVANRISAVCSMFIRLAPYSMIITVLESV